MIYNTRKKYTLPNYRFCSFCASPLEEKNGNLYCVKCFFINYRNPRPTVTALVLRQGKILLTKRGKTPFKDWWDLPGGFLESGESPEEAIKRELLEETGLKVEIKNFFGVYVGTYPSEKEPFSIVTLVYLAESKAGKLGAEDDVMESRWFPRKKFPKRIAFDSNNLVIKDFLKIWK